MAQPATFPSSPSVDRALEALFSDRLRGEVTARVRIEAQPGHFEPLPEDLPAPLRAALGRQGIEQLYSHQLESYRLAREQRHLVVVTPTASGKTLCYNLPVLEDLIRHPNHRALYLFPTKALAQDQMAQLRELITLSDQPLGVHTYDGDTPADMRRRIRNQAGIVLTNPDMLHTAILPHHPRWVELFQTLRYVVVDELHTYRGVFGSHVANVFRRLKRVARFYNSEIQFITTSATIANPRELAERLLEEKVELVESSGAPRASRELIFYNPPLTNPELGLRGSALTAARRFAAHFLKRGIQTLIFAGSRVNVEVLLRYLKNEFDHHPGRPQKVRGYRGGYLPRTRREIERQLRRRELLGVVSTNALELGVDIGSLDAVILAGYPGSVASTWQQIGRAGRRRGHSVALLVARNRPLDQFMVRHPDYFLEQSPEHGLIEPDNLYVLVSHIRCAAFELPFRAGESFGGENLQEILQFLTEQGTLQQNGALWNWTDESYPANSVSLRNIAEENFVVLNTRDNNRAIAEVDFDSAPELIHPEAIYMCEGRQYHVERLDYKGRRAYVRPVRVDYYTEAITYSGLRILQSDARAGLSEHGEVHLVRKFPGFKKIKFYTTENVGYGPIELPLQELHTTSYWLTLGEAETARLDLDRQQIIQGLLGVSYAMHHVAALLLMCDVRDLGRSVGDRSTRWFAAHSAQGLHYHSFRGEEEHLDPGGLDRFEPTIFLHDIFPGGVGLAEKLFEERRRLIQDTADLVRECPCQRGCPSCVGPLAEVGEEARRASLAILELLLSLKQSSET